MTTLKSITSVQAKSVKVELKSQFNCRVQVKNGTMYIYHSQVNGSFSQQEKSAIRDALVLNDFVSVSGQPHTSPQAQIFSGMGVRAI